MLFPILFDFKLPSFTHLLTVISATSRYSAVRIKKKYVEVKVMPEPSTKNTAIGTLKGGDVVEKVGEKSGWVKVRFADADDNTLEGWVSQTLIEKP